MNFFKSGLFVLVLAGFIAPAASQACVIGAMYIVPDRNNNARHYLASCEHGALGPAPQRQVNISALRTFLADNGNNQTLTAAAQTVAGMPHAELLTYLRQEMDSRHTAIELFSDNASERRALESMARIFNDVSGLTDNVAREQEAERRALAELQHRQDLPNMARLNTIAAQNGRIAQTLSASNCTDPEIESVPQDLVALDITFADGYRQVVLPLPTMRMGRPGAATDSSDVTILDRSGAMNLRQISRQGNQFTYRDANGVNNPVRIQEVSYRQLTQIRPFNSGSLSDRCYLGRMLTNANWRQQPPAGAPPASLPGQQRSGS